MNKFFYFMVTGLAFTALQVVTVEADPVLTIGDPACATVPPAAGCPPGSPGFMEPPMCGDVPCPPPEGTVPMCAGPLDTMIPCPPPGGDAAGESCASEETPALVAACVARKTACMPLADDSLPPHCQ